MNFTEKSRLILHNEVANGQWTGHSITTGGITRNLQELTSLQSLGITAIDYNNGRYEYSSTPGNNYAGYLPVSSQNNGAGTNYASIQTLTLDASNDGIRYTPVGAGIKIDDSSGDSEILITQILSEQALFDRPVTTKTIAHCTHSMPATDLKKGKNTRECRPIKTFALQLLLISALSPIHANAQVNSRISETTYRKIDFEATICKKPEAGFSAENIYLIKKAILKKQSYAKKSTRIEAVKFSNGIRYGAAYSLSPSGNQEVFLVEQNRKLAKLDCKEKNQSLTIGSKYPVNNLGHYLDIVNVADTGAYGTDVLIEVCKTGAHCDYGTQGLVLKNHKGDEIWARLIAIKDGNKKGHPTYSLPELQGIRDGLFDAAYVLDDDSIILIYDNLAAIRIFIKNGYLLRSSGNVSSIDLKDWAELKSIYSKRFLKMSSYCFERKACDILPNEAMYFYSLQSFLFPKNIQEK
jgi:hypothetical protein